MAIRSHEYCVIIIIITRYTHGVINYGAADDLASY